MDFKTVRVWFEKKGSARFISHLDLTRIMARALKLSRLPVWYTEGFNPRIYMNFAMPLSLGTQGERECMEIRLVEEAPFDAVVFRLNQRLPADIRILKASEPVRKLEEIAWADYEVFLESEDCAVLERELCALLDQPAILVMKHGKKGDKEVDIKGDFAGTARTFIDEKNLRLAFRLPCSVNGSVNPNLLLEALKSRTGLEPDARIVRKRLLTEDFSEIR